MLEDRKWDRPMAGDILVGYAIESRAFRKGERGPRKCPLEYSSWSSNGARELFMLASINVQGLAASTAWDLKTLREKLTIRSDTGKDQLWVLANVLFFGKSSELLEDKTLDVPNHIRDFLYSIGRYFDIDCLVRSFAPTGYSYEPVRPYEPPAAYEPARPYEPSSRPYEPYPYAHAAAPESSILPTPRTPPRSPQYEPASPVYCPVDD
jgi:hypothetical protein